MNSTTIIRKEEEFMIDKKIARALAAALLLFLIGGTAVFATGAAEDTEKPTLVWVTSVQGGREPEENPLFEAEVERLTGVRVQLIKPPGSEYNTKLSTMLASGEQVDIAYAGGGTFVGLYEQDLLEPLTDRIAASSVLSDPAIIPASEWERVRQADGEIYGVFNKFEQGTMAIIRGDWLDKLGLSAPQTFDDYYDVLYAFTYDDPDGNGIDDTYGMAIGYTLYDTVGLFGAYGLMRGWVYDESGELYSPYASDAAIPVYEWLAKIYADGLLEPNFVTNNSGAFRELFMTNKSGMNWYWAAWVGLYNQQVHAEDPNNPFEARGIAPPVGPGGRLLKAGDDGFMVIPGLSEYKDEAFEVAEFWHTFDGNILSTLGILGHDYTMQGGKYVLTEIGAAHAMDHGAPQPKSLAFVNPLGSLPGFDEAATIVREYAVPQMATAYNTIWEDITRGEAAKIILGDITAAQGVANMRARFAEEGIGIY
jgi:putative aldouronate transport system substrate-binding protein